MSEELKPCPFCGNDCILVYEEGDYGYSEVVKCQKCGIQFILPGETNQNTINAWNTRHESGELPQWAIDAIEKEIFGLWEEYAKTGITRLDACARKLEWVLSLRNPEENKWPMRRYARL